MNVLQIVELRSDNTTAGLIEVEMKNDATTFDLKEKLQQLMGIPTKIQVLSILTRFQPLGDMEYIPEDQEELYFEINDTRSRLDVRTVQPGLMSFEVYQVDNIYEVKQCIIDRFGWWQAAQEYFQDINLDIYAGGRKLQDNDIIENRIVTRAAVNIVTKEDGDVSSHRRRFNISMLKDLLRISIMVDLGSTVRNLIMELQELVAIVGLKEGGIGDICGLIQNGQVLKHNEILVNIDRNKTLYAYL